MKILYDICNAVCLAGCQLRVGGKRTRFSFYSFMTVQLFFTLTAIFYLATMHDVILVIFKMFIIMGMTWFSELFGFALSWSIGRDKVWKYFVFNDMINLLQGVLIFIVLICKPSVLNKILPKMPKKKISVITNETVIQSKQSK